ncbi:MAG: ferritin-like domain-containing protein [Anaerolineaceae bacterium]|nr:ferritin-like domain-containing protein [Anaerolineaceae bacterium]
MNEKSIELLNKAVADEIFAAHQYMFFSFHCEKQSNELLSGLFRRTAVQEMRHVERCARQILLLGGEVEMTASNSVQKIHGIKDMLEMARKMETGSISDYTRWALECAANSDKDSRKIFRGLLKDEEIHYSQFGLELERIS